MKLRDYLAIALLIIVAVGGRIYTNGSESPEKPRRPDPRQIDRPDIGRPPAETVHSPGRELPRESRNDPRFVIQIDATKENSVGTAFSIDPSGIWVTARHVTNGCDLVGLQKTNGRLVRVSTVEERPSADISILHTRGGTRAMRIIHPKLQIGADGYSFGYPRGEPGDVYGRVIGRARMLARGRYRTEEPVVAWTQIRRIPDKGADLSGISGGPWVNAKGEVIGVHVAGSPRRGRSYSTAPRTLIEAARSANVRTFGLINDTATNGELTPTRFDRYGNRLRRDLVVAKVVCLIGEKWRRQAAQQRS